MRRDNALSVAGWRQLFAACSARADEVQRDLECRDRRRNWTCSNATGRAACRKASSTPTCFPDNVFFLGDRLSGLIDFYFACTDTLVYDVAICLNAWCFEADHAYNVTKGRALLASYAKTRVRCRAQEWDKLPLLARGAALRFLLTRLVDWLDVPPGALVRPKDPMRICAQAALPSESHERARLRSDRAVSERAREPGSQGGERTKRCRTSSFTPTAPVPAIPVPAARARSSPSATARRSSKAAKLNTTNNRMELMAAIAAFEALKRPCRVDVHTDSQYLRNGILSWINTWKTQRLAHRPTRSRSRTSTCGSASTPRSPSIRSSGTGCAAIPATT